MSDFIWLVGFCVLLYYVVKFSAWVMCKFIFASPEKYKHWLEED